MTSTLMKFACAAVLMVSLSGCILYVSPDHRPRVHPEEKPAPTTDKTKI